MVWSRAAGQVFGVSASTAIRLAVSVRQIGSLSPKRQGRVPGMAGKLAPHRAFLLEIVAAEPDNTLAELGRALADTHGVTVAPPSIRWALVRGGLSNKKARSRRNASAPP